MDLNVDVVGSLSPELVNNIFLFLSPKELSNALKFNEQWKALYNKDEYWKSICEINEYVDTPELSISEVFQKYLQRCELRWKAIYYYNKLESNFRNSNYRKLYLNINKANVIEIYQYDDELLLLRTDPEYLQITNVFTLETRKFDYKESLMNDEYEDNIQKHEKWLIVITSDRKTIKVYDYESFEMIFEKSLNPLDIKCIKLYKNLCGIISKGETFSILNLETEGLVRVTSNVACVCIKDDRIIVGKHAGIINVLDLGYNHLMTFNYYASGYTIEDITKCNEHVVVLLDGDGWFGVNVFNLNEPQKFLDYQLAFYFWSNYEMDSKWLSNNILTYVNMIGNRQACCTTVNLDTNASLSYIDLGLVDHTRSLMANENFIFVMSTTCKLKVWCRKTGVLITEMDDISDYNFKATASTLFCIDSHKSLIVLDYEEDLVEDV